MRLIIIDNVSVQDIADILGTRGTEKTEEPKECTQIKVGDRVQVDDPNTGYHTGAIDEIKDGSVHLSGVGWFSGEFCDGEIIMIPDYTMPVISIDFDGVIVQDKWPEIGEEIPGAVSTINQWYDAGYWIIINSCRDHKEKADMIVWLQRAGVRYHAMNENLDWRIAQYGTDPRKIGADIYIDDHNIEQCRFKVDGSIWGRYAWIVERYMRGTPDA